MPPAKRPGNWQRISDEGEGRLFAAGGVLLEALLLYGPRTGDVPVTQQTEPVGVRFENGYMVAGKEHWADVWHSMISSSAYPYTRARTVYREYVWRE